MRKLTTQKKLYQWLHTLWLLIVLSTTAPAQDFTNNGGTVTAQYTNTNAAENFPKVIDNDLATKYYINFRFAASHVHH